MAVRDVDPVVVGISAAPADDVVAFAFAEADRRHVPLVAEHVWCRPADRSPAREGADGPSESQARAAAQRLLDDAVTAWSDRYPEVPVRRVLRHGLDPAFALTASSRTACLVVVGPSATAGGVTRALLHRAGCPVAVVRRAPGGSDPYCRPAVARPERVAGRGQSPHQHQKRDERRKRGGTAGDPHDDGDQKCGRAVQAQRH